MTPITFVQNRSPLIRLHDIPEYFGIGRTLAQEVVNEIKDEIAQKRYGKQAVVQSGRMVFVNLGVLYHYMTFREEIKSSNRNIRNSVPDYEPKEFLSYLGILLKN